MPVSNEEKLQDVISSIDEIALLGYRFDQLLEAFKIYNKMKNTLDIEEYETVLDMFVKAIYAMEENMFRFQRLFVELKDKLGQDC
jgi:hypothetical protein